MSKKVVLDKDLENVSGGFHYQNGVLYLPGDGEVELLKNKGIANEDGTLTVSGGEAMKVLLENGHKGVMDFNIPINSFEDAEKFAEALDQYQNGDDTQLKKIFSQYN